MSKENAQMVIGVVVLLLLSLVRPVPDTTTEPETAIVVDSLEGAINDESRRPAVTERETEEPGDKTTQAPEEALDFLEAFNEDELEEESGDVQAGIDLLNNPLQ